MSFSPEHLGTDVRRKLERAFCASVGVVTTLGLLVPMGAARAEAVQTLVNYLQYGLAQVLYWISQGIAYFIFLLMSALIDVAQYNNFDVVPVQVGWPLVRDIVNMFFIVLLLVSAFSTIIGYRTESFGYKKVLPRLLIMAVLVNFSRTLIGLLIDFSQVLMLTFVNGFKAAGVGNLVTAFKLDKVMAIAQKTPLSGELGERDSQLTQILLSLFLAVFILGITATTLLIMVVYLIVRVIGLWIALIFSPMALFATAVPDKLGKGLSVFTGKYWDRLGAMLSGGPIMAFFIWLTLATVQSADMEKLFIAADQSTRQAEQAQAISYFSSAVGTSSAVTTFLVAIIMLLMGLDAAVSISGEVSKGLGKAAEGIKKGGMRLTRYAAYGGILQAGSYASRQVGRGGAAAGNYAFRKLPGGGGVSLEQRTGRILQRTGIALGSDRLAAAGGHLREAQETRRKATEKTLDKRMAGMSKREQRDLKRKWEKGGVFVSDALQEASALGVAKYEISAEGQKELNDEFMKEAAEKGFKGTEQKAYAQLATRQAVDKRLKQLETTAKHDGDEDAVKKYKELREKRPDQIFSDEDYQKEMTKLLSKDPREVKRTVGAEAFEDSRTIDSLFMSAPDLMNPDGSLDRDHVMYKTFVEPGGNIARLIRKRAAEIHAATAPGESHQDVLKSGVLASVLYAKDSKGDWQATDRGILLESMKEGPDTTQRTSTTVKRKEPEIRTAMRDLKTQRAAATPVGARTAPIRDLQRSGMEAGASLEEVYDLDGSGRFVGSGPAANKDDNAAIDRTNFTTNIENTVTTGATNLSVYEHLNLKALDKNKGAKNEARALFAGAADVGKMKTAWQAAKAANNQAATKVITDAVRVTHDEGSRVEDLLTTHNQLNPTRQVNIAKVVAAAAANDNVALQREIADMSAKIDLNEAKALRKKREIDGDPVLSTFREHASRRARVSASRGGYVLSKPVTRSSTDDEV